jgi:hypothetical protein
MRRFADEKIEKRENEIDRSNWGLIPEGLTVCNPGWSEA